MLPVVIGIGIAAILVAGLFDKGSVVRSNRKPKARKTNQSKKLFISFAIEDAAYRNFLVAQARNNKSPFSFVDMSVREPWNEDQWKRRCRSRISSCDGLIVLLSNKTWHSGGSRWEIKCANEESIPVVGMHIKKDNPRAIPPELQDKRIITWSWKNLEKMINKM